MGAADAFDAAGKVLPGSLECPAPVESAFAVVNGTPFAEG